MSDLSRYAQSTHWHEYENAYKEGSKALEIIDDLQKTNASLKRLLPTPAQPALDRDSAAVTAQLQTIAAEQNAVEQDANKLVSEWNSEVVLDAQSTGVPHGARGAGSTFSAQSAPGTSMPVMDVRPLLLRILQRMDWVSKTLQDMHPAVNRGVADCFMRSRRQAPQTPAPTPAGNSRSRQR